MNTVLYSIGSGALFSMVPALTLFVILYAARSDWQSTREGKAVMALAVSMDAVLIVRTIWLFLPAWEGWLWIRALVNVPVAVACWALLVLLIVQQRHDRNNGY